MPKRKPAIFTTEPVPVFRTQYEREKYWAEEKRRAIEGYSGMPGTFYHSITQQHIKHRIVEYGKKDIENPKITYGDLWLHEAIQNSRSKNRMLGVVKARGFGFSSQGGFLANYFMLYYPGSRCIVTARDKDGISVIFKDKILPTYENYHTDIKPAEVRKNETVDRSHLSVEVVYKLDDKIEMAYSSIECRETVSKPKSVNNFSGLGANFGFYDEFPLHPRRNELLKSSIECFKDPVTKKNSGFLLWGGTCEETMTDEDIKNLKQTIDSSDIWQTDILFIPFWWKMFLDENGHPNKKKAFEWWETEAERLEKAEDKSLLKAFIRNNPRSIDDIFATSKGNLWEEDVHEKIVLQKQEVLNAKIPLQTGSMVSNGSMYSIENGKSHIILEHPVNGCEYIITIDGVQTDDMMTSSPESKRSKIAAVVTKLHDPRTLPYMPVCIYAEVPKSIDGSLYKIIELIRYYNRMNGVTKVNAERNVGFGSRLLEMMVKNGLGHLACKKKDFSLKGFKDKKEFFYYRDEVVLENQLLRANGFLRKHIQSIKMLPLLDEMLMSREDNTDILDAWLGIFETIPDIGSEQMKKPVFKAPKTKIVSTFHNGRLEYVVKPV